MTPDELQARRKRFGLSQARLADLVGLSPTYVGQLERGTVPIKGLAADLLDRLFVSFEESAETCSARRHRKRSSNAIEYELETALIDAGVAYAKRTPDHGRSERVIFQLLETDIAIEANLSPLTPSSPKARITIQGRVAAELLAKAIRKGGLV